MDVLLYIAYTADAVPSAVISVTAVSESDPAEKATRKFNFGKL